MPLEGEIGNLCHRSIRRKPFDPDVCPPLRSLWTASSHTSQTGAPHRSDRYPPVRSVWSCYISVFGSSVLALWTNQGTQWFSGEPLETPRTRCSLRQSPLMTRLPRSPGSTLILRLNQEIVHDFILLFMPPCGPHLTPLATGSLEPSLLVFSTLESSPATTFHACSSPAPTPVKPQPAPTILSQESVHTMLSITHNIRKRHPPVLEPHMVLS
jgi:hypothetical protein